MKIDDLFDPLSERGWGFTKAPRRWCSQQLIPASVVTSLTTMV